MKNVGLFRTILMLVCGVVAWILVVVLRKPEVYFFFLWFSGGVFWAIGIYCFVGAFLRPGGFLAKWLIALIVAVIFEFSDFLPVSVKEDFGVIGSLIWGFGFFRSDLVTILIGVSSVAVVDGVIFKFCNVGLGQSLQVENEKDLNDGTC